MCRLFSLLVSSRKTEVGRKINNDYSKHWTLEFELLNLPMSQKLNTKNRLLGIIFSLLLLIKRNSMKRVLFGIAMLLFVGWIIGCFMLKGGSYIHILAIVSAIACMQAVIITPKAQAVR